MTDEKRDLGRVAYEAFHRSRYGKNCKMLKHMWYNEVDKIDWRAAAEAVAAIAREKVYRARAELDAENPHSNVIDHDIRITAGRLAVACKSVLSTRVDLLGDQLSVMRERLREYDDLVMKATEQRRELFEAAKARTFETQDETLRKLVDE